MQEGSVGGPGADALQRLIELLWETPEPVGPGRKPGSSVEAIVRAAIAIADEGGLDAVTVRAVAAALGRSPMSLYSYVRRKDDLLDLMYDRVLGELPESYSLDDGWRAAIENAVRDHWDLHQRHPWMLRIPVARPGLGPNTLGAVEAIAAILHAAGLEPVHVNQACGAISTVVRGSALAVADVRTAAEQSGLSDDEWWSTVNPALEAATAHIDWADRYPTITHLADSEVFEQLDRSPDDTTSYLEHDALATFHYSIGRLLDGIQTTLDQRPNPGAKTRHTTDDGTRTHPP